MKGKSFIFYEIWRRGKTNTAYAQISRDYVRVAFKSVKKARGYVKVTRNQPIKSPEISQ